ncbi:shieldin complex subunit 3 [Centropristis striata]|uniref:shieldin complex subunit 3 n=1 Tax=Centropristis striata TaxID=184440 RepID=UPI0027E0C69D|nr:shieldin complex subunit 3 [Centropristis striata]
MEDVVLHYQPGSAAGLSCLLETTEKLLEWFPCRIPPVFTPWSPAATDRHLPIRPAQPAPVITRSADLLISDSGTHAHAAQEQKPEVPNNAVCISETPNCLLPESEVPRPPPDKHRDGVPIPGSPLKRSWSVFTQKGVVLQCSLSEQLRHTVSVHRLHLHQRAKWVVRQHNCGASRDIEQVWRALSRSAARSSRLPTCNANIQRERAEVWVFCDVLHAEQVGRFLKDELQLSGRIELSVHRRGNIFSM